MRDGSVMADSDLVDFLSGPTDSAINFNGSADLHTPIHPPPEKCALTSQELNWNQTKLNICHHMLASSTHLQKRSFTS